MSEPSYAAADDAGFTEAVAFDEASEADWGTDLSEVVVDPTTDIERTGDPAADTRAEVDAVVSGFRSRMGTEADRVELLTMSDYYTCLVFPTSKHLEAFMSATGWAKWSDFGGNRYVDGRQVAKALGVELPPDPDWPQTRRDASYDRLAMSVEDNRALDDH